MSLQHALSQLAILGATSIVLRGGRVVDFGDVDQLLDMTDDSDGFILRARGWCVEVVDAATGRLVGRAAVVWQLRLERLLAASG
jgi:hypothetical protein